MEYRHGRDCGDAIVRALITKQGLRGLKVKVKDHHETDLMNETSHSRSAIYRTLKRARERGGLSLPEDCGGFPGERVQVVSVEGYYFVRNPPSKVERAHRTALRAVARALGKPILLRVDNQAEDGEARPPP